MNRYLLEVIYDGACFHGSQVQGDIPTVQLALNNTLSTILRRPVSTYGASRTDEGVHALSNYYHFDLEEDILPNLLYKCNAILPHGVAVKRICLAANPEFNARFDAIRRSYRYRIYKKKNPFLDNRAYFFPFKIDRQILTEAAATIMEYRHFESFSKRKSQNKTFECVIHQSRWEFGEDEIHYVVEANRFLRGMVRGLVGTQLHVARGKGTLEDFRKIIEAGDCTQAYFDVPGCGLYLEKIEYRDGAFEVVQEQ